jgi:hypothetical protein
LTRLAGEEPWKLALDAFEHEPREIARSNPSLSQDSLSDSFANVHSRAVRAVADGLRRLPPCEAGRLQAEEVGRPMRDVLRTLKAPGEDAATIAEIFTEIEIPGLMDRLVRAGRLAVDSELTLKILELRLERAGSADGRWPARLLLPEPRACPGAVYQYTTNEHSMSIAFEGSTPQPPAGLRLPLSFSSGIRGTATTASPAPTATPKPDGRIDTEGPLADDPNR